MFVAVVPPAEVVADLEKFVSARREAAAFRWTPPEHWHLTLAFLEQVPDRALDDLVDRLGRAAAKRRRFDLRLRGGGAIPHADRARVLYARTDATEADLTELERMATGARAAAGRAGIKVDGRRFLAHLTLARVGHPENVTNWIRLLDAYSGPEWTVDHIALIRSHLGEGPRKRPRYETVETFGLG